MTPAGQPDVFDSVGPAVHALGVVAMVGGNARAIGAAITDPGRWGIEGWLADVVPHLCYGLATACTFDLLDGERSARPHDGHR